MIRAVEPELIAAAQAGDRRALAEVLRRGDSVARAIARCHPSVEHDDALQIARVGLLVGLGRWRPGGGLALWPYLSVWAHGLLAWEAKRGAKRRSRQGEVVSLEDVASDLGASAGAMEDAVAAEEVLRLVDAMPAHERCVALGRFMHGHTLEDVGDVLDVSRERVRQMEPDVMRKLRARATRGARR